MSHILLEKKLQKQMGTMVGMAQGAFQCSTPWLVLPMQADGCWQHAEARAFLSAGEVPGKLTWHMQPWGATGLLPCSQHLTLH